MFIRVLAATLAGGIAMFGLGYVIYALILDPYIKMHTIQYGGLMKEPMPDLVPLFCSNLVGAFLFALVFDQWAGIRTFAAGLVGGALLMFLIVLMIDLQYLAFMNLAKDGVPLILDVLGATVLGSLSGGVIAFVLGLFYKPAAAD
jgi:hypothetical protein